MYAARYRATHRLDLLAAGVRYRQRKNPDAYPRVASLKHPEDYSAEDIAWVECGDKVKRDIQDKVKGISLPHKEIPS